MGRKDAEYQAKVEQRRRERAEAAAAAKKAKKKKIIKISVICIVCIALIALAVWGIIAATEKDSNKFTTTDSDKDNSTTASSKPESEWVFKHDVTKHHFVEIKVKDYGTIKVELAPEYAPITVDNYLNLVESKFYDGLTFHRAKQGFMIQGGDPLHNGNGGSDTDIKGEFSSNGVKNDLSHKRGVISMARSQMPNSASSQFFICDADSTFLDGNYAAFGWVVEGMDVVDKIAGGTYTKGDNDTITVYEEQPVIESIKIVE